MKNTLQFEGYFFCSGIQKKGHEVHEETQRPQSFTFEISLCSSCILCALCAPCSLFPMCLYAIY